MSSYLSSYNSAPDLDIDMGSTFYFVIGGVLLVGVIGIIIFAVIMSKKEGYRNYADKDLTTNIASRGTSKKYWYGGQYHYQFVYNLPITNPPFQVISVGKNFNSKFEPKNYDVYLGKTKDAMKRVGQLVRHSDGFFKLEVHSKEDYKYGTILIGDDLVDFFPI